MNLAEQTVIVTGANRGVGRVFVEALLERGVRKIYAGARDVQQLAGVVALDPARVEPVRLDLTDPQTIADAAKTAADVTLLINNAGVLSFGGAFDVHGAALTRDMSVNFNGTLDVTRVFAPILAANGGGAVVNMLSLLSFVSVPGFAAYNASKAAAWSMTMSMRPQLASTGVSVVNVFPAGIDTEMLAGVDGPKDHPERVVADTLDALAAGQEDVYPGSAAGVYSAWRADHKQVERMFAAMG